MENNRIGLYKPDYTSRVFWLGIFIEIVEFHISLYLMLISEYPTSVSHFCLAFIGITFLIILFLIIKL